MTPPQSRALKASLGDLIRAHGWHLVLDQVEDLLDAEAATELLAGRDRTWMRFAHAAGMISHAGRMLVSPQEGGRP